MGNVADKEMQFSPMDLPNKPEFALENSLFVLQNRACRGGRGFKPLTLGKYYDSMILNSLQMLPGVALGLYHG